MVDGLPVLTVSASLTFRSNNVLQKQQQQKDESAQGGAPKKKKVTAAQLRVQRGMDNLLAQPQSKWSRGLLVANNGSQ